MKNKKVLDHKDIEKNNELVKVFVYGSLRKGCRNSSLIARSIKRKKAYVKGILYDLMVGFPAFKETGDTKVIGELLEVKLYTLLGLDGLEGHPTLYYRKLLPVFLEDGSEVTAWVYTFPHNHTDKCPVVECGDWCEYLKQNKKMK